MNEIIENWKVEIVGKTIDRVSVVEQDELLITFSDGSSLSLSSFGWAEGVTAEGSEIVGEFNTAKVHRKFSVKDLA